MASPARSRRDEYSEITRQALIDSAASLFAERGFAGASLEEVTARARVTKGALYHHFRSKRALFEAVFDAKEVEVIGQVTAALRNHSGDPTSMVRAGLAEFLEVCLDPGYQRIVLQEGPSVLGYERWREREEQYTLGIVGGVVSSLMDSGEYPQLPLDTVTRMLFGALIAGASAIAGAADKERVRAEVEMVVMRLLYGLRAAGA
ncbi:MAG: TetR family transcriptional regulator [Micromonosporaceae bacterium]|nr:TetR family transcriptional regulator [Micromonosporaceae bacterium]